MGEVRTYEIEAAVPIPRRRTEHKYPYASLAVGESFLVVDEAPAKYAIVCAHQWAKRRENGRKFTIRKLDKTGWRIWRVE